MNAAQLLHRFWVRQPEQAVGPLVGLATSIFIAMQGGSDGGEMIRLRLDERDDAGEDADPEQRQGAQRS